MDLLISKVSLIKNVWLITQKFTTCERGKSSEIQIVDFGHTAARLKWHWAGQIY